MARIEEVELLPHQYEFLDDNDSRYLALCGGYGCGKTFAFCMKAINLALINEGCEGAILEPTIDMAKRTLIPQMCSLLSEYEIEYEYMKGDKIFYITTLNGKKSKIHVLSGENYTRLVGLNLAWWGVDEIDTIRNIDICDDLFSVLVSRLRDRSAVVTQGFFTSTPEGFHFLYKTFVKEIKENRRIIKGKTFDNPYLAEDYVESLLADYTAEQIQAYVNGEFVNLTAGTVYDKFDRALNHSNETAEDNPTRVLHVGMDFNVGKCCAIVHIVKEGTIHAVDEVVGRNDTADMIEALKDLYPKRPIYVYPDSSSGSRKTNSSKTDLQLLRDAGFTVKVQKKNPFVRDRVNTMNARFCNSKGERKYYVNTTNCIVYTQSLEQQSWKKGEPDKSNDLDHPVDAAGYFITTAFPLKAKATIKVR